MLLLSAGNVNDISMAADLLDHRLTIRRLVADRGYDANHLRQRLAERKILAVIPSTTSRAKPIPHDAKIYSCRNRIERMWGRIKDFRRIATRYDKLARNYLSAALIAAAVIYWVN